MTDDLIDRIRQKDRDALVDYIEQHHRQLLSFIDKSLSDTLKRKVEAQDILQEVSLSALGSLDEMDLSERDPFSWLCQLAERRIIDAHRKYVGSQKRAAGREVGIGSSATDSRKGGFMDFLVASLTTASKAFSRGQKELKLLEAIESLPPESRDALRMRYVDNLPSKEIAEKLGKTDGAVRVMLTRTLDKLQQILASDSLFDDLK